MLCLAFCVFTDSQYTDDLSCIISTHSAKCAELPVVVKTFQEMESTVASPFKFLIV